jgi:Fic family protein
MSYEPIFTITPRLLALSERISALRQEIMSAPVQVSWVPRLQRDSRVRNTHSSTAIEGNPLSLDEVRALEEGRELPVLADRARWEVLNYLAGLRYVENKSRKKKLTHDDILGLHSVIAKGVMDRGRAGRYRESGVRVGAHAAPPAKDVSGLMRELLEWWNERSAALSPVLTSSIIHHRFEEIHPFADGNGRTGRALALWELYRRGFDTHHVFSIDEFYWSDRPRYYRELNDVRGRGGDLTCWLEYAAEGIEKTLGSVRERIRLIGMEYEKQRIVLRPKQEKLLRLLNEAESLAPSEIWEKLSITRQGAAKIIKPLLEAGLIRRGGGKKTGRYSLSRSGRRVSEAGAFWRRG